MSATRTSQALTQADCRVLAEVTVHVTSVSLSGLINKKMATALWLAVTALLNVCFLGEESGQRCTESRKRRESGVYLIYYKPKVCVNYGIRLQGREGWYQENMKPQSAQSSIVNLAGLRKMLLAPFTGV